MLWLLPGPKDKNGGTQSASVGGGSTFAHKFGKQNEEEERGTMGESSGTRRGSQAGWNASVYHHHGLTFIAFKEKNRMKISIHPVILFRYTTIPSSSSSLPSS
jgi:hypothetical protein